MLRIFLYHQWILKSHWQYRNHRPAAHVYVILIGWFPYHHHHQCSLSDLFLCFKPKQYHDPSSVFPTSSRKLILKNLNSPELAPSLSLSLTCWSLVHWALLYFILFVLLFSHSVFEECFFFSCLLYLPAGSCLWPWSFGCCHPTHPLAPDWDNTGNPSTQLSSTISHPVPLPAACCNAAAGPHSEFLISNLSLFSTSSGYSLWSLILVLQGFRCLWGMDNIEVLFYVGLLYLKAGPGVGLWPISPPKSACSWIDHLR